MSNYSNNGGVPRVNLDDDSSSSAGNDCFSSNNSYCQVNDYTSCTTEVIVKPILLPKPSRPTRNMMKPAGNPAEIKSHEQLNKAYALLRDKQATLIMHINESNNNWGARDRCATTHLDNFFAVSSRLNKANVKLRTAEARRKSRVITLKEDRKKAGIHLKTVKSNHDQCELLIAGVYIYCYFL